MLLQKAIFPVKLASTVLMSGAIALELLNRLTSMGYVEFNSNWVEELPWLFAFCRFALIAHGIEAAIAMGYAVSRKQNPIADGIYVFFTGTVGLWERVSRFAPIQN